MSVASSRKPLRRRADFVKAAALDRDTGFRAINECFRFSKRPAVTSAMATLGAWLGAADTVGLVADVERLLTIVDERDQTGRSVWAHLYVVLSTGDRRLLLDDRGWAGLSAEVIEDALAVYLGDRTLDGARAAGPFEPYEVFSDDGIGE